MSLFPSFSLSLSLGTGTKDRPCGHTGKRRPKGRVLTRHQLHSYLNLGLPASRAMRKYSFVVEALQATVFCYGSLSGLRQGMHLVSGTMQ